MKCHHSIILAILMTAPINVAAEGLATIAVPISAHLADIQAFASRSIPEPLVNEERAQTCVEAQKACTKIPEFRGFKIYSRMECVQVTPSIDCTVAQRVWREGPFQIEGSGPTLTLRQQFGGTATVRGRGEIGRHIRETANAAARLTVDVQPRINADWSIEAPFDHVIEWPRPPTAVLFNIFPVTFRSLATDRLNGEVERFRANDLQRALEAMNLRARMATVWRDLQTPKEIALGGGSKLYLHFRPERVGMSPLNVASGTVSTILSIAGRTQVTDDRASPFQGGPTDLPNLSKAPTKPGFELELPITVGMDTLTSAITAELPRTLDFNESISGAMTIRAAEVAQRMGRLHLVLDVVANVAGYSAYAGAMTISGVPHWSPATETISLSEPTLELVEAGLANALLERILNSAVMRRWIEMQTATDLGPHIRDAEAKLNAALNRELSPGLQLHGTGKLAAPRVEVAERLHVVAQATAEVRVEGLSFR